MLPNAVLSGLSLSAGPRALLYYVNDKVENVKSNLNEI